VTAPLSDDVFSPNTRLRAAADLLPVVRDIAAREAARAVKTTAMSLRAEGEFRAAERCDALGAALLAYPPRALGLDPTHGKATR
jgi:hypothetical protein